MINVLNRIVSLSAAGSVTAGLLLLFRPLFKDRVGKTFTYYLWLIVLLRLCLPFGVSIPASWLGGAAQETGSVSAAVVSVSPAPDANNSAGQSTAMQGPAQTSPAQAAARSAPAAQPNGASDVGTLNAFASVIEWLKNPALWLTIWAAGVVVCLGWHMRGYVLFTRTVRKTATEPGNDDLAIFREFPVSTRVRYVQSAYVKTPMLIGLLRPTVVVPDDYAKNGLPERLRDIFRHELMHCRRHDLAYKWFTVFVTSLHWFNPLMFLIRREIGRACELSCDEAVIRSLDTMQKQHYGETLLSLADRQPVPAGLLATTFCEERNRLKERLVSIMKYKTASRSAVLLSALLLLGLVGCSAFSGIKAENTAPASTQVIADATPIAAAPTDMALYEKFGMEIAIPNEYADQLLIFTESKWQDTDDTTLISVFEKKSYEDCQTDNGGDGSYYAGFIFSIARYTQAQYEQFLCSDGSGQSFFAKDDTYYYGWCIPTDVQFYRSGGNIDIESDGWKAWIALNEKCAAIRDDFTLRNHLTSYSDNEFKSRDYTYDGAHMYLTYYPYYAYQSTAEAQGFNWKDKAYTLVLTQPAAQGDKGIWCVERWYDNGTLYYEFPYESGQSASDYFAARQNDADIGKDTSLLDPEQAALVFVKNRFDHQLATADSFKPFDGALAGNVLQLCNEVFGDMGTLQKATYTNGAAVLDQAFATPAYYDGPLRNYTDSRLYPIVWIKAQAPAELTGDAIVCRNSDGGKTLTFYQQDGLLCVETDGTRRWFKPAYADDTSPYEHMLSFYEEFSNAAAPITPTPNAHP